jgi:3-oxoacyl-[acyl-carrier protein] reductase
VAEVGRSASSRERTVLIAGGTSGIGLATAHRLADEYRVIVAGRKTRSLPEGVEFLELDVLNQQQIGAACRSLEGLIASSLYGFIYSVGISAPKRPIETFDPSVWMNVLNTNVTGAMLCLKHIYPFLKKEKGRVVFVNSVAGRTFSGPSGMEYATSKAALAGLARQLAVEWAKDGVVVNSVFPSMTRTPMLESRFNEEQMAEMAKKIPLGRLLLPSEVAEAIAFLLHPGCSYMTGCGVDIHGGQYYG